MKRLTARTDTGKAFVKDAGITTFELIERLAELEYLAELAEQKKRVLKNRENEYVFCPHCMSEISDWKSTKPLQCPKCRRDISW